MIKVMFICHGNICRSPMAEFVMKKIVKDADMEYMFHIESSATSTEEIDNPVYPPAKKILAEHGINCSGKFARQMTFADYKNFDYIIAMDYNNIRNINRIIGYDTDNKVHLLMHYTGTDIGEYACYASSLENITFPKNLTFIGEYAFFSSPKLTEINLPQSTKNIGDYAFAHCVNLQKAIVPLETELFYSNAFEETADNFIAVSADTIKLGEEVIIRTYERNDDSTYAFYYKHESDTKWHSGQTFSDMNIAVIAPKKSGNYLLCAKIKDTNGSVIKNYCNITVTP